MKSENIWSEKDTIRHRWGYFIRLMHLLWTLAPKPLAVIMTISVLNGLMPLASLFALRHLVDQATELFNAGRAAIAPVFSWASFLIGLALFQQMLSRYGFVLETHAQEQLKERIQQNVMIKAQSLPLAVFEEPQLFDRLQRVQTGLDQRLFSTMAFIFRSLAGGITVISLIVYLGTIHWIIPSILTAGCAFFTWIRIIPWHEKYILQRKQTPDQRQLQYLADLMTGREAAMEIRLFGLGNHLLNLWHQLNVRMRSERLGLARREFYFEFGGAAGLMATFGITLTVIFYTGTEVSLTTGLYAVFITAAIQFQDELRRLFWDVALVNNDLKYIQDFFDYMDLPENDRSGRNELPDRKLSQGIVFEQVSFAYPGSNTFILRGLDLVIRPGERIALVGENGAGKTTLVKLLLGLYSPVEGRILIDGIDLAGLDPSAWRQRTAAIFQDYQRYLLKLKENIAVGDIASIQDEEKVKKAAWLSGADEVAAHLPQGYETQLGKEFDGIDLSQGQWQKIAVARAYMRQADILVLDEPTAALDPKAEVEVYKQFRDVSQGRTVLLISHRLGAARLADRILVLEGGRITEEGTHAELLNRNGYYSQVFRIQSQWYN